MILEYNGGNFDGEYLAYFYATWSSNCNIYLDALKKIDYEIKNLRILRINISKYYNLKKKYLIKKIPTFILLNGNNVISRLDGYIDQYSLLKWIKNFRS